MTTNSCTETTRLAELYRNAALDVESKNGLSCCAVTRLVSRYIAPVKCAEALRYVHIYADNMMQYGQMVGALEEPQDFRVMALCFAAAMVEAGDADFE